MIIMAFFISHAISTLIGPEIVNFDKPKKQQQNNCKKLNIPVAILKNPYYTPYNTADIITPPCNTDQVITPMGDMTYCISNLSHMQN